MCMDVSPGGTHSHVWMPLIADGLGLGWFRGMGRPGGVLFTMGTRPVHWDCLVGAIRDTFSVAGLAGRELEWLCPRLDGVWHVCGESQNTILTTAESTSTLLPQGWVQHFQLWSYSVHLLACGLPRPGAGEIPHPVAWLCFAPEPL